MSNAVEPENESHSQPLSSSRMAQARLTHFILIFAFSMAVIGYAIVCVVVQNARPPASVDPGQLQPIVLPVALALLALSTSWLPWRIVRRGKTSNYGDTNGPAPMRPSEFQTGLIIALALAESASIFGLVLFFLGSSLATFLTFAAGTLVVNLCVLLPRTLAYWSANGNAQ